MWQNILPFALSPSVRDVAEHLTVRAEPVEARLNILTVRAEPVEAWQNILPFALSLSKRG